MTADQIKEPEPASRAWDNAGAGRPSLNPQAVAMSGRHWTPYELEVILHHADSLSRFDRDSAPLYATALANLSERGLFKRVELTSDERAMDYSTVRPTEKCKVFVEMLLGTPEPRSVWLDPRDGKEIMAERSHPTLDRTIDVTKSARDWLA